MYPDRAFIIRPRSVDHEQSTTNFTLMRPNIWTMKLCELSTDIFSYNFFLLFYKIKNKNKCV